MLPIIWIAVLVITALAGVGMIYFMYAVFEVLKIILILFVAPLLVKFFADYIANYFLKLDEKISLLLGVLFTIPVIIVLYMNFYALLVGATILGVVYFGIKYFLKGNLREVFSLTKWFVKEHPFKKGGKE